MQRKFAAMDGNEDDRAKVAAAQPEPDHGAASTDGSGEPASSSGTAETARSAGAAAADTAAAAAAAVKKAGPTVAQLAAEAKAGHGMVTDKYRWMQTLTDVTLCIQVMCLPAALKR